MTALLVVSGFLLLTAYSASADEGRKMPPADAVHASPGFLAKPGVAPARAGVVLHDQATAIPGMLVNPEPVDLLARALSPTEATASLR